MSEDIDLSEIDKKYKDKCSLIKAGTCKNVNIFLQQSRKIAELKEENKIFTLEAKKLVAQYSAKLEWQRKILQEIKEIAEKELYLKQNNGIKQILQKITKAEEE